MTAVDLDAVNRQAGARVRELRTGARLSQDALVDIMRERGHRWAQATVSNVEAGTRGLGLSEVVSLADLFSVDPADFLALPGHHRDEAREAFDRVAAVALPILRDLFEREAAR